MSNSPFRHIGDVIRTNKANGFHFFDSETMEFFNSHIGYLAGGRYFVTSEQFDDFPRRYTIRYANDNGSIETVGKFQQYDTVNDAITVINGLLAEGVATCDLCGKAHDHKHCSDEYGTWFPLNEDDE